MPATQSVFVDKSFRFFLHAILISLTACANIRPNAVINISGAEISSAGEREAEITEKYKKREFETTVSLEQVKVFVGSVPVDQKELYKDHKNVLNFRLGLPENYTPGINDRFFDYRNSSMKPYCFPQTILSYATLFVWNAVPLAWPCLPGYYIDREELIRAAREVALTVDADLVVAHLMQNNKKKVYGMSGSVFRKADPSKK